MECGGRRQRGRKLFSITVITVKSKNIWSVLRFFSSNPGAASFTLNNKKKCYSLEHKVIQVTG
jgi:hypothetical protein